MILPPDTRTLVTGTSQFPYSPVVHLAVTFPNGITFTASGVMIGPNDLLTAAHVVYHAADGGYPTAIVATPGKNGSLQPFGTAGMRSVHVDSRYPFAEHDDFDYAVVTLDRDIGLSTGWHAIASPTGDGIGEFIKSLGYPSDKGGDQMYWSTGTIDASDYAGLYFTDDLDVRPGQSGSPVFFANPSGNLDVVGLISYDHIGSVSFNATLRLNAEYASNIAFWAASNDQTNGDDYIFGGDQSEAWNGLSGNDTIAGFAGNDTIRGGFGNDDLNGNVGNDAVYGEDGSDFARGGQGNDTVFGGPGDDWHVNGNIGNDLVYGDDGHDRVHGGPNNDLLYGGAGNDFLSGDLGNDTLVGGAGADLFSFGFGSGVDRIADFDLGQDSIYLETTHTKFAVQGGTYVDLGGGHGFTVANVSLNQLTEFYFL